MAQIKVTLDPNIQSPETTIDEVMSIANDETPVGVIPTKEPIRDDRGRPVAVYVGIPDWIDNQGVENARAKIQANHGVSKAVGSKTTLTGGIQDFSGLDVGAKQFTIGYLISANDDLEISDAFEYSGATQRAIRFTHKSLSMPSHGYFQISGDLCNISYDALGFSMALCASIPTYDNGVEVDYTDASTFWAMHDNWNNAESGQYRFGRILIEVKGHADPDDPDPSKNNFTVRAKIGASDWKTFSITFVHGEWIQLSGMYSGAAGTGSVTMTKGQNTEIQSWEQLSGLQISDRSDLEFALDTNVTCQQSGHPAPGFNLNSYKNSFYIDELSIDILNILNQ